MGRKKKEETALVPQTDIIILNDEGMPIKLRPNQHLYLRALAEGKTQKEAREVAGGISRQAVHQWMQENDYTRAYQHLFGIGLIETHRQELIQAASDTADLYQEAMTAEKIKVVKAYCPKCNEEIEVEVMVEDWNARLRAAKMLDQVAGMLKEVKAIEGSVNLVAWDAADLMALMQLRAGRQIPEENKERLRKLGIPEDELR